MEIATLTPGLLVQTPNREILQISNVYDTLVTAEVVYPMPGRTTVRSCTLGEVDTWREPTDALFARYEIAWGYR